MPYHIMYDISCQSCIIHHSAWGNCWLGRNVIPFLMENQCNILACVCGNRTCSRGGEEALGVMANPAEICTYHSYAF